VAAFLARAGWRLSRRTVQRVRRDRKTLAHHGVRHRYGAVGRTGSIALIERFFLTPKTALSLGSRPPVLRPDLERRLALFFACYTCLRPHRTGERESPPRRVRAGPAA